MLIDFSFELDEKVETELGEVGIITMLGVDESGRVYYVQTKNCGSWHKDRSLKKAEG